MDAGLLEIAAEAHVSVVEKEVNPEESSDLAMLEAKEESTDMAAVMPLDISLMNEEDEAKMKLNVSNWNDVIADLSESWAAIGEKNEMNMVKATNLELQQGTEEVLPVMKLEDDVAIEELGEIEVVQHEESTEVTHQIPPSFAGLGSCLVVQPSCLTPVKSSASKASATKKRMTAVSDNKENIGSGSKLVPIKERVEIAKNAAQNVPKLDDLSIRKLMKMLKEKLEITNKSSKNEKDNEVRRSPHPFTFWFSYLCS